MRKRIFEIIEVSKNKDKLSAMYDIIMMFTILISVVPLMYRENNVLFNVIDKWTAIVFIVDYILRFITADYKLKKGKRSFIIYPFTFMALIDLISILPLISVLNNSFRLFKIFRIFRTFKTFRVFRVFKSLRYSRSINLLIRVFSEQKESLLIVGIFAIGYIFVSALIIFQVEPETFNSFFKALYWATVSLTTVGYGDIYATSTVGQVITMISSIFGVAIVALPSGIISAGCMKEIYKAKDRKTN